MEVNINVYAVTRFHLNKGKFSHEDAILLSRVQMIKEIIK